MSRFAAAVVFIIFSLSCLIIDGQSPDDVENKCGGCPCNNPCTVPSSPPPPPSPSPPPPVLPPPSSPPPPKKPPSTSYCPPPPSNIPSGGGGGGGPVFPTPPSQYIYFTGPPGNLYPVDQNFSQAARRFSGGSLLLIGVMLIIALW